LAIIDEHHSYIGEEYTLALTLNHALAKRCGPVVINCSSSRMSADIAARYGCPIHMSAVGEANVAELMINCQAVYGGEGNGGPIDPRVGYVRDSFVGIAQVLEAMALQNKSVSQLVAELPRYEICKTKVAIEPSQVPMMLDRLEKQFPDAASSRLDGLRLDWPDRWLLVRPSNTEPIVRAIAEATTLPAAQRLCHVAQAAATAG
jgi:phosphomannomutase